MKPLSLLSLAAALLAGGCALLAPRGAAPAPRLEIGLERGWRFHAGEEPLAADPGFDDSAWTRVDLPHTWNARDGQDGGGDYRRGAGWYRRRLEVGPGLAGRRLYLQFDGASLKADVWVNGRHLGTHEGGFARFRFDATDALRPGAGNVVAVRVDNGKLGIPPTSADFTFFGGLYRGVSLLATDPVQVSALDYGSPGVYLIPRQVSADSASIEALVKLENRETAVQDVEARVVVTDARGGGVLTASAVSRIEAGGAAEARIPLALEHPHLWNARADPYLYSARIEVWCGGRLRDVVTQPLGLRFFRVDPDQGFFLNGRHWDLHGVSRHQDRIDKGWAIGPAEEAEDFGFIQELGCTAVRVSHYQQADSWYARCDRAGLAAWAEIPFVNDALPSPDFLENAEQQLRELIRQNYNHPAIFFWGVGNETRGAAADHVIAELAAVARAEDPTRLSTYASNHKENDPKNWHTDLVAFNRYLGWYSGSIEDFARNMDEAHVRHPRSPVGLSEYGAGASLTQHKEHPTKADVDPKGPRHPEEYQSAFHEAYWAVLKERPYVWVKFIWTLFDFAADDRNEGGTPGRNDKGLVTYDRKTRKDAFYFYQANWSDRPVLHITSAGFTPRASAETEVRVYSNAPEVSLSVGGADLGRKSAPDHVFVWPVRLAPGENRIEARAEMGGRPLSDSCVWTLSR